MPIAMVILKSLNVHRKYEPITVYSNIYWDSSEIIFVQCSEDRLVQFHWILELAQPQVYIHGYILISFFSNAHTHISSSYPSISMPPPPHAMYPGWSGMNPPAVYLKFDPVSCSSGTYVSFLVSAIVIIVTLAMIIIFFITTITITCRTVVPCWF